MYENENSMKFKKIKPSRPLQDWVKSFWVFEDLNPARITSQRVIPFGSFEWIFSLGSPSTQRFEGGLTYEQPRMFLTGQFTQPVFITPTGHFKVIGVSFYPWAGSFIAGDSAKLFTNATIDFTLIDNRNANALYHKICEVSENEAVKIIESYLLKKKDAAPFSDLSLMPIIKSIQNNPVGFKIRFWRDELGYSIRRLEQKFKDEIGLSAGVFVKKIRVHKMMQKLQSPLTTSLTDLSLECGFYDQSHAIRDFKQFIGLSPRQYLQEQYPMRDSVAHLLDD